MAALLLIRHCQATGGGAEAPLTAKGMADALALAAPLKRLGIDAVYASPYARAVATLAPAAAASGLELRIDGRLREREAQRLRDFDTFLAQVRRGLAEPHLKLEGEESFAEAAARGLAALADIADAGHRLAAIATHGQALTAMLRSADPRFGFEDWRAMGNPALFLAHWEGERLARFRPVLAGAGSK